MVEFTSYGDMLDLVVSQLILLDFAGVTGVQKYMLSLIFIYKSLYFYDAKIIYI